MINEVNLGDCFELLKEVPDASVDLVLTDPPYALDGKKFTDCKWDLPFDIGALWKELLRVGKPNCPFVFFSAQPFTSVMVNSMLNLFKFEVIWVKSNITQFGSANKRILPMHENILFFWRKHPHFKPIFTSAENVHKRNGTRRKEAEAYSLASSPTYDSAQRYPTSVQFFKRDRGHYQTFSQVKSRMDLHPTQKPQSALQWIIRQYSKEGDTVLDPFAGAFSAAVAAKLLNRNFLCFEQLPEYCELGKERLRRLETAIAQPLFFNQTKELNTGTLYD